MKKFACLYAVVRFMPFVETGEFANVGIVMMCPEEGYFDFKLMMRRHARVTQFFEQLDSKIFRATMSTLRDELERVRRVLRLHGLGHRNNDVAFSRRLFADLVHARESIVKFSEPRGILVEAPQAKLDELYGHYVERDFVTKEYQESVLERGLRRWISEVHASDRFARLEIGNEEYEVSFPFVEQTQGVPVKAIKPLHLAHDQPSKILDHGGMWLFRVQTLKRRDLLPPKVLFAVGTPKHEYSSNDDKRLNACREIVQQLRDEGVRVEAMSQKHEILNFIAA
jgi:hypothetical protein